MKTLAMLITINEDYIYNKTVAFCSLHSKKVRRVKISKLTDEELRTKYFNSEWWIEDGDLCVCPGK